MVYGTQITIVMGGYKPTNITGGPHIVWIYGRYIYSCRGQLGPTGKYHLYPHMLEMTLSWTVMILPEASRYMSWFGLGNFQQLSRISATPSPAPFPSPALHQGASLQEAQVQRWPHRHTKGHAKRMRSAPFNEKCWEEVGQFDRSHTSIRYSGLK